MQKVERKTNVSLNDIKFSESIKKKLYPNYDKSSKAQNGLILNSENSKRPKLPASQTSTSMNSQTYSKINKDKMSLKKKARSTSNLSQYQDDQASLAASLPPKHPQPELLNHGARNKIDSRTAIIIRTTPQIHNRKFRTNSNQSPPPSSIPNIDNLEYLNNLDDDVLVNELPIHEFSIDITDDLFHSEKSGFSDVDTLRNGSRISALNAQVTPDQENLYLRRKIELLQNENSSMHRKIKNLERKLSISYSRLLNHANNPNLDEVLIERESTGIYGSPTYMDRTHDALISSRYSNNSVLRKSNLRSSKSFSEGHNLKLPDIKKIHHHSNRSEMTTPMSVALSDIDSSVFHEDSLKIRKKFDEDKQLIDETIKEFS